MYKIIASKSYMYNNINEKGSIIGDLHNVQSKMFEVVEREYNTIKRYNEKLMAPLNYPHLKWGQLARDKVF